MPKPVVDSDGLTAACPFCGYASGLYSEAFLAYADEHVMVLPTKGQKVRNRGHCLVVPRAHVPDIYSLPDELAAPLLAAVRTAALAVKRAFAADGVTVRQNNEPAGGQDVFHLHFHVVPRYSEDDFEMARYESVDEATRIKQAEDLRRAWSAVP